MNRAIKSCSEKVEDFVYNLPYNDEVRYNLGSYNYSDGFDSDTASVEHFQFGIEFGLNAKHDIYILEYNADKHKKVDHIRKSRNIMTDADKIADAIDDEEDVVMDRDAYNYYIFFDASGDDDVMRQIKESIQVQK